VLFKYRLELVEQRVQQERCLLMRDTEDIAVTGALREPPLRPDVAKAAPFKGVTDQGRYRRSQLRLMDAGIAADLTVSTAMMARHGGNS
jgi:hypothetical protein